MSDGQPDNWWERLENFRKDMKEKGIHVGTSQRGSMPTCVTCGELWPCSKAGKG